MHTFTHTHTHTYIHTHTHTHTHYYDAVDGESESADMHPSQAAAIKQGDRKKRKNPKLVPTM